MVIARSRLEIFPPTGPPGMRFELTYRGSLCPKMDFDFGQIELAAAAAASGHIVKESLTVPADEIPGSQSVSAKCQSVAGRAPAIASAVFVVTAVADHRSTFVASFPTPRTIGDSFAIIYHSPAAAATVALLLIVLAVMSWVFLGFPAEWFNDTWQANEERIKKAAASLLRTRVIAWWPGKNHKPDRHVGTEAAPRHHEAWPVLTMLWFLLVGAALTALLDRPFHLDRALLWVFIGISIGLAVTTLGFQVPYFWSGRKGHGHLKVLGSSVLVAALCVAVSRLIDLDPPYLYGLLCVYSFSPKLSTEVEARVTTKSMFVTLLLSLGALATDVVVSGATSASQDPSPVLLVLEAALDTVCTAGLGTLAFGLIPLPFLPGQAIAQWNRYVWGVLFASGVLCFLAVMLVPEARNVNSAPAPALFPAAITFSLFMLFSGVFMLYFHRLGAAHHRQHLNAATETGEAQLTSSDLEHGTGTVVGPVGRIKLVERAPLPTEEGTRVVPGDADGPSERA